MTSRELHQLSALEQAAAVRRREIGPVELVEHCLERVQRLDPLVGAFITVTPDRALAQAREAERLLRDGRSSTPLPPLLGVPTAVKDLNATAGIRTTRGSAVLAEAVPDWDDAVVSLMRAAGTISLGKTTTPEFGLPCYSEPDVGRPARTPWDLTRSAGGSSGGAGAAVAAELVPFAHGSDGGGSIRIPASVCGLVGLKPSRGRVSAGPLFGDLHGLGVAGPLARTVADAAALLDAMAVPMPGDPHWAPPPSSSFLASAGEEPGRLRIGRYATPVVAGVSVDPECLLAWESASELLVRLGHDVVDVPPPFGPEVTPHFETLWAVGAASIPLDPSLESRLRPLTRWLRERGRAVPATGFAAALAAAQLAARRAVVATAGYDAVLTPTLASLPVLVGGLRNDDDPAAEFEAMKAYTPFTATYNLTGQPAVSLPLYWTAGGLPVGVQLAGRPAGESGLLRLAGQVEAEVPWRDRRPPLP